MIRFILVLAFVAALSLVQAQQYTTKYLELSSQQQRITMAYVYEQTAANTGKTIVLLHGKNFSATYFNKMIAAFLNKGYNVLAPDQVGFGLSSKPFQYQFSFHQLALNTKLLLDTLGISKPILFGHSMGGMLAIRMVLQYPDDFSQLVLEDPLGLEDWKPVIPYSSIDEEFKKEKSKTTASLKKYMLDNYFHNEWKPAYDTLLAESSKNLQDEKAAWCMALTSDMIYSQPVYYEFKNIRVPVILIIGELDKTAPGKERAAKAIAATLGNYPRLAKEAAAIIPRCKLVELKGIGHIPHIENFAAFMHALEPVLIKN